MPIRKGNKRITVALSKEYIVALDVLKSALKTKNNTIAIKHLLDLYILQKK